MPASRFLLPFVAFRVAAYRVFWGAVAAHYGAFWTLMIARGFLVFDLTGSSAALGAIALADAAGMAVGTPLGGMLADRSSRLRVVRAGHWALAAHAAAHFVVAAGGWLDFWWLLGGAAGHGLLMSLMISARQAMTGDIVSDGVVGNAMSLQEVAFNLSRVVLPTTAGAIIGVQLLGASGVFALLTLLMVASALLMLRMQLPPRSQTANGARDGEADGGERSLVRYLRERPALFSLMAIALVVAVAVQPYLHLAPAVIAGVFARGPVGLGLFMTTLAVGALVTSLAVAAAADGDRAWRIALIAAAAYTLGPLLLAISPGFSAALAAAAWIGISETTFLTLKYVVALRFSPPALQGRMQALSSASYPVSGVIAFPLGALADLIGLRPTLMAMGILGAISAALILWLARRMRAAADAVPHRAAGGGLEPVPADYMDRG